MVGHIIYIHGFGVSISYVLYVCTYVQSAARTVCMYVYAIGGRSKISKKRRAAGAFPCIRMQSQLHIRKQTHTYIGTYTPAGIPVGTTY